MKLAFALLLIMAVTVALIVIFVAKGAVLGMIGVVVLGLSAAISLSPPDRTRQVVGTLGFAGPLSTFVVALFLIGESRVSLAFHETAAQVIPVLVLALAVEARVFSLRRVHDGTDVVIVVVVLGLLASGEYEALRAIYSGVPGRGDVVGAAIAAGFAGLAVAALTEPKQELSGRDGQHGDG